MGEVERAYTRCPMCRHVFRAPRVGTYVTVGREPDLCPKFPGRLSDGSRVLQSEVTMCPACSFASREGFDDLDLSFAERHDLEERLKEDGLLRVFRSSPPPWLAFHAAEVCGQERALPARQLGDLCLRASWVCLSKAPSSSGPYAISCAPSKEKVSTAANSPSRPTSSASSTAV